MTTMSHPHMEGFTDWQRLDRLSGMSASRKTRFTVPNNSSPVNGFSSIAASCKPNSSAGLAPDARMTGNAMRAERSFLTNYKRYKRHVLPRI
jgi:hypothetical protein